MAAKLTRLTHKIGMQLHIVAESCTISSSHSRRPVRKPLDTPLYFIACSILLEDHRKGHTRFRSEYLNGRYHFGDLGVERMNRKGLRMWIGFFGS
jgi:hypothetical protein